MKSKIAIVIPSLTFGGAEKVSVNLANSYLKAGHEVYLIVFGSPGGKLSSLVSDSVNLLYLNKNKTYKAIIPLVKVINEIQPKILISSILESNIILGLFYPFLRVGNLIFRQANTLDNLNDKNLLSKIIYIMLMKYSYRFCAKIIANSEDTRIDLIRARIGRKNNIVTVSNPVISSDVYKLGSCPLPEDFPAEKHKYFLNVGRLTKQKRQDLLIDAFSLFCRTNKDYTLVILGSGDLKKQLLEQLEVLGLAGRVFILPPSENPFPIFKNAFSFVLSSEFEGFGNVLVEAMAFGVPIISTNCKGGPSSILLNGKLGELVDIDSSDLCKAMHKVASGNFPPSDLLTEHAKNFDIDVISRKYLEVLSVE